MIHCNWTISELNSIYATRTYIYVNEFVQANKLNHRTVSDSLMETKIIKNSLSCL